MDRQSGPFSINIGREEGCSLRNSESGLEVTARAHQIVVAWTSGGANGYVRYPALSTLLIKVSEALSVQPASLFLAYTLLARPDGPTPNDLFDPSIYPEIFRNASVKYDVNYSFQIPGTTVDYRIQVAQVTEGYLITTTGGTLSKSTIPTDLLSVHDEVNHRFIAMLTEAAKEEWKYVGD